VVFLKVTRAGSPARDLNTTGMWSCAQQNFEVLVEQALFIPSPGEGLPVHLCRTEIASYDREDLSHLKFHIGNASCGSSVMLAASIPLLVVVARVFRRGGFLRNWQANLTSKEVSYNPRATGEQNP
jgi:hypothetical protein